MDFKNYNDKLMKKSELENVIISMKELSLNNKMTKVMLERYITKLNMLGINKENIFKIIKCIADANVVRRGVVL